MNTEQFSRPLTRLLELAEQTQRHIGERQSRKLLIQKNADELSAAAGVPVEGGLNPIGKAAPMLSAALLELDRARQFDGEREVLAWSMVIGTLVPFVQEYLHNALTLRGRLEKLEPANA